MHGRIRTLIVAAAGAALLLVGPMAGTVAAHDLDLDPGVACTFGLGIDVDEPGPGMVYREWYDADGNLMRTLQAGTGVALTFTNMDTGATYSTPWNGSVISTVYAPDGSQTVTMTGHTILIMFPTDVPAGPSTTLYIGRVVFTVDAEAVSTIKSTAGRRVDICAALS
jgi:hypothetical protein